MNSNMKKLEERLRITFRDPKLLKEAFTHSSFVNERKQSKLRDNERLEYLGDAVLELTVSEYLYHAYPDVSEGELTKMRASIVCEPSLVKFAEALEFGSYVYLGKGEQLTGGRTRPALLADVFEAFVGALYLDQGLDQVKAFLREHVFSKLVSGGMPKDGDFKTRLQEHVQQFGLGTPEYRIVEEQGPAHDRIFIAEVTIQERVLGRGVGRSKKEAEQSAASKALDQLQSP